MNNDTSWLWVVGIVAVGVVVAVFAGASLRPGSSPHVGAGPDVAVKECCSVRLTCEATDPGGGPLTYLWTSERDRGTFDNSEALHPLYRAPSTCGGGEDVLLTLTVKNSRGLTASDSLVVHVFDTAGCSAPWRGAVISPLPCCANPVPIDALPAAIPCVVTEPLTPWPGKKECEPVSAAVSCPVPSTSPALISAPCYSVTGAPCGVSPAIPPCCESVAPCCPTVPTSCASQAPICACPPACPEKSMDEGTSIQLCGSVCDPDGNLVSYLWGADKGTFDDAASLNPVYFAPMTDACNGEDVCITLTAVDRCGARGCDRLTLHINNVNHAPIAHAGEDFCVSACTAVQLTGATAADPDGDQLSYAWTVANGRGVFDDPHVLRPAFSVPSTPACGGEDLVLTLTVTDACGAVSTDSLTIHVSPLGISSPQW